MNLEPPEGWGSDGLSDFMEAARRNTFATFVNLRSQYALLLDVDRAFTELIKNLKNARPWYACLFLLRAHAAFRGGVRFAVSGQVVEAYMVLRGCIEAGLYGLFVTANPDSFRIWLERHKDNSARAKCRGMFAAKGLFELLESRSKNAADVARNLYERTIDEGAHPNEKAILTNLRNVEDEEGVTFNLLYLTDDSPELRGSLKTTAQVGICVLDIFALVFRERMDLLGLTRRLDELKRGL